MNISLDYDDTYTRNPELWDMIVRQFQAKGDKVFLVTWRFPDEEVPGITKLRATLSGIHFTCRTAKEKYMFDQGINIHVWIDDNPRSIIQSMEGY